MENKEIKLFCPARARKPGAPSVAYSFRISQELSARFMEMAESTGMNVCTLLARIFEEAFDHLRVVEKTVQVITLDWREHCELTGEETRDAGNPADETSGRE